ncbi:hypothetical protein [Streptosporangium sp. NPDC048865]
MTPRTSRHSPTADRDLATYTSTHPITCRCVACCALALDNKKSIRRTT